MKPNKNSLCRLVIAWKLHKQGMMVQCVFPRVLASDGESVISSPKIWRRRLAFHEKKLRPHVLDHAIEKPVFPQITIDITRSLSRQLYNLPLASSRLNGKFHFSTIVEHTFVVGIQGGPMKHWSCRQLTRCLLRTVTLASRFWFFFPCKLQAFLTDPDNEADKRRHL